MGFGCAEDYIRVTGLLPCRWIVLPMCRSELASDSFWCEFCRGSNIMCPESVSGSTPEYDFVIDRRHV